MRIASVAVRFGSDPRVAARVAAPEVRVQVITVEADAGGRSSAVEPKRKLTGTLHLAFENPERFRDEIRDRTLFRDGAAETIRFVAAKQVVGTHVVPPRLMFAGESDSTLYMGSIVFSYNTNVTFTVELEIDFVKLHPVMVCRTIRWRECADELSRSRHTPR
jgi:hypothetical protein